MFFNDKRTDSKVCWTVLNSFLNNINISSVPPIFTSNETITNIAENQTILINFLLPSVLLWKTIANFLR